MKSHRKKYADAVGQKIDRIGRTAGYESLMKFIGQSIQQGKENRPGIGSTGSGPRGLTGKRPDGQQAKDEVFYRVGQFVEKPDIPPGIRQSRQRGYVKYYDGIQDKRELTECKSFHT